MPQLQAPVSPTPTARKTRSSPITEKRSRELEKENKRRKKSTQSDTAKSDGRTETSQKKATPPKNTPKSVGKKDTLQSSSKSTSKSVGKTDTQQRGRKKKSTQEVPQIREVQSANEATYTQEDIQTFNTLISELEINTQFGTVPLLFHSIQSFSNGTHIPVYSSPFGFWVAYPDGSFSMLPQHLADHLMNI